MSDRASPLHGVQLAFPTHAAAPRRCLLPSWRCFLGSLGRGVKNARFQLFELGEGSRISYSDRAARAPCRGSAPELSPRAAGVPAGLLGSGARIVLHAQLWPLLAPAPRLNHCGLFVGLTRPPPTRPGRHRHAVRRRRELKDWKTHALRRTPGREDDRPHGEGLRRRLGTPSRRRLPQPPPAPRLHLRRLQQGRPDPRLPLDLRLSSELVDPVTGALTVSKHELPVRPHQDRRASSEVVEVLTVEESDSLLRREFPGGTATINTALGECFQHLIGLAAQPRELEQPEVRGGGRRGDHRWSCALLAERKFEQAFAETRADLPATAPTTTSRRCALHRQGVGHHQRNIKGAARRGPPSKPTVSTTKGTVTTDFKSYRCSLPMKGTPNDLSAMDLRSRCDTDPRSLCPRPPSRPSRVALDSCL